MGDPGQVDRNADEAAERDRAGQALVETVQGLGSSVKGHGEAMGAIVEAVGLIQKQIDAIDARVDAHMSMINLADQKADRIEGRVDANMRRIDAAVSKASHAPNHSGLVGLLSDEVKYLSGLIRGTLDRVDKWENRVARLEAAMNRPAMERLEFIQKACLQAGHDLELALQQAMGEALRDPESAELAGGFPTIDPSIATKGDVEELNAWGVAAAQRLRDAGVVATSAPIVKRLAEIIYGLRDLGKDERLVKRMGGDKITSRTWAQAAPAYEHNLNDPGVRGPDRAVVVSEGVLGQILSHVATGNPDAAVALTTPVAMAPRAEYHEIKASDYGPEGFPIKPAGHDDLKAAGGST